MSIITTCILAIARKMVECSISGSYTVLFQPRNRFLRCDSVPLYAFIKSGARRAQESLYFLKNGDIGGVFERGRHGDDITYVPAVRVRGKPSREGNHHGGGAVMISKVSAEIV